MRVLFINVVCGIRSTGRICVELAEALEAQGHEVKIAYGRESVPARYEKYALRIGSDRDVRLHGLYARLFDAQGLGSRGATKRLLAWAEEWQPELLWLHNLHGYYLNYELLFDWIRRHPEMEVRWTLHDCWAFTGHCTHFSFVGCEQWKTRCLRCPQRREYPASLLLDGCARNFARKKAAFTGLPKLKLITPSAWLAGLVRQSFLKDYPVEVCYNTIDTAVFKPTPGDFRERCGLTGKKLVLGVASVWSERKGLGDFLALAGRLGEGYTVVLVGLSEKQLRALPEGILGLPRTNSPVELAEIYTAADVFVNPTYEDTYPTTNLEAQACGTPALTYRTGGSPESVPPENVVPCGDLDALAERVREICSA